MIVRIVEHTELKVGDRLDPMYDGTVVVTILREPEIRNDRFDRPLAAYWARREDTGAEGFLSFGPGGVVRRITRQRAADTAQERGSTA